MDISTEFTILIKERKAYQGDIDYESNATIKAMVTLLSKNIDATIKFLDEQCNGEQLVWMSEIFDEIAEITKSKEFINALYRVADRFSDVSQQYNIKFFIDSASEYIG